MTDLKPELQHGADAFPAPRRGLDELRRRRYGKERRRRVSAAITAFAVAVVAGAGLWQAFRPAAGEGTATGRNVSNGPISFAIGEVGGAIEGIRIGSVQPDGSQREVLAEGVRDSITGGWSPDGRQVAFVMQASDPGRSEIWVMDADGAEARRLTSGSWLDHSPKWAPTGDRIAFVRFGEERVETDFGSILPTGLWIMNADGSNPHPIVSSDRGGSVTFFSWSPDGSRLAYGLYGRGPEGIFTIDANGSNERHIFEASGGTILWSPEGSQLLFDSTLGVSIMDADGSNIRTIISGAQQQAYESFRWSPDGSQILYVRPVEEELSDQLRVMNIDGSNDRLLAEGLSWRGGSAAWSPDGSHIAFERDGDIWTVTVNGSGEQRLTSSPQYEHSPVWGVATDP